MKSCLLQGRVGCVKTWLAVDLQGVVSRHQDEGTRTVGASLRVDEVPMSGFQACDSLRFDLQRRPHHVAPTTKRARVVRGLGHFSSRKQQGDRLRLA
jgi:hypothetical protein